MVLASPSPDATVGRSSVKWRSPSLGDQDLSPVPHITVFPAGAHSYLAFLPALIPRL